MTAASDRLPRWNTTDFFPSLLSPEFAAAVADAFARLDRLEALFAERGIGAGSPMDAALFERTIGDWNALQEVLRTTNAFVSCFTSVDSRDDAAQAKRSELMDARVRSDRLGVRFAAWCGGADLEALLAASSVARDHRYRLECDAVRARHQMTPEAEDLAASLNPSGGGAWARLHGNLTSQLTVRVDLPDGARSLPMSAVRGLARHADAAVREAAYRAELEAWSAASVPLAAALNSIKGEGNALNARRGWAGALEPALFQNGIDADTLGAMQSACAKAFPDFRRYFRAKARLLGRPGGLPWFDLFAPLGATLGVSQDWSYAQGEAFIVEQFGTYSGKLADFAARAFREGWVDAEPRDGKRDGAFCMSVRGDVSRVMMNYTPNLDSVSTLAHELGHAYHNLCKSGRSFEQGVTPMTLAETASIFCETIVMNAALEKASGAERLAILETELQGQAQVVVDIHSRFLFESRVFEARAKRELSVAELNAVMLEAQRETYGVVGADERDGGLDAASLHPYMWAVKGHYYATDRPFYNFPYTFGLLFGLGLYARYRADPDAFRALYDDLLSSTGLADAATLAARFGMDTRSEGFWASSLDVIRARINAFEALAAQAVA